MKTVLKMGAVLAVIQRPLCTAGKLSVHCNYKVSIRHAGSPMPRDPGLEELVHCALGDLPGLSEKFMFGGWAFLLHGNLLCGARRGSLMLRVGPDNESWALTIPGVNCVVMRGRRMRGYVRAAPEAYCRDGDRQRLLNAAIAFTLSLPKK